MRDAAAGWPEAAPGDTIDLREEWLQVVAHDLRTPLGINIGYAALLLDQGAFDLPPEARELVQHMRANGEWMLELVDGILELATLRAAPPLLRYEPVTPGEILDAVAERMRGLAEPKGVRITRTRLRTARPYALDRMRIEQVLHNLVANAIRFSRPGGAVHLGVRKAGSALAFRVRDTGRGMTREEAASAFSKFAAPGGGHGLGLAIARAIVELHGGRISVRTEPGRGSTFTFTVVPGQDGP